MSFTNFYFAEMIENGLISDHPSLLRKSETWRGLLGGDFMAYPGSHEEARRRVWVNG